MLYSTTGQLACKRFLPSDYYGTFFGSSLEALRWLVVISVAWREMAHGIANSGFTLGISNTIHNKKKKLYIHIVYTKKISRKRVTRRTETPIILSDQSFLECDTMYVWL